MSLIRGLTMTSTDCRKRNVRFETIIIRFMRLHEHDHPEVGESRIFAFPVRLSRPDPSDGGNLELLREFDRAEIPEYSFRFHSSRHSKSSENPR